MIAPVTSLQPRYSLLHREVETEILPHCQSERDRGDRLLAEAIRSRFIAPVSKPDAISLPKDDWQKTTGAKGIRISMNQISRATWRWSII